MIKDFASFIHYCGQFWPVIPHTKLYDPRPETRVTPIPTVAQRDTAAVAQTTSAAASRCGQPPSSCAPPFFSVYELLTPCAHNLVPRLSRAYGKRAPIQNPRVVCNDLDVCVCRDRRDSRNVFTSSLLLRSNYTCRTTLLRRPIVLFISTHLLGTAAVPGARCISSLTLHQRTIGCRCINFTFVLNGLAQGLISGSRVVCHTRA